ncbi:hypothetical protein BC830DRAFT_1175908 [Chytriomyces sp. MP71]|nr:hypothetical protein BC830DRAFT_1175908 [Chytriomyces sp. MP71]
MGAARVALLERQFGPVPVDAGLLSFWAAQWSALDAHEEYKVLSSVHPHERMVIVANALAM